MLNQNLRQRMLFRKCVDTFLNMYCPFVLLHLFPGNPFLSFIEAAVYFYIISLLLQELSYMMSFIRRPQPSAGGARPRKSGVKP